MTLYSASAERHGTFLETAFDPNRADAWGALLSAMLPVAAVIVANCLFLMAGLEIHDAPVLAPVLPDWVSGLAFVAIYPMWGLARWAAWQNGENGRRASWWVVGLIAAGIAYPFVAGALEPVWVTFANSVLMVIGLATALRLVKVSRLAFLLVLPTLVWVGFATLVSFAVVAQGWSPPFAVTNKVA